ncbi:hypothetical protein ACJBU6_05654 [Exserohilum turcicum]
MVPWNQERSRSRHSHNDVTDASANDTISGSTRALKKKSSTLALAPTEHCSLGNDVAISIPSMGRGRWAKSASLDSLPLRAWAVNL